MSTGHVVGYIGGLAVALGVGTAVMVSSPTASADTSSASSSSHGAFSGTAKSARATQRTTAMASIKRVPARRVDPPASSVTLLMATSAAAEPRSTTAGAALSPAAAATHDLHVAYDAATDTTSVTVVDRATDNPIGSTVTLDGSAGTPVLSPDATRGLITTTVHDLVADTYSTEVAVMNMTAGGQIGSTLSFADASPMSGSFAPDGTRALVTLFLEPTSQIGVAVLDTTTGTQTGTTLALNGYPFVAPVWNAKGTRVMVTLSQLGGETTAVTVLDATTGTWMGTTILQGFARNAPLMTADGTRAVLTTTVHDPDKGDSARVTVVDTTTGALAGNNLRFPGTAKVSLLGDSRIALVTNGSGLVSILDTRTATATPRLPLLPPWGLDAATFFRTPLGAALAPAVFLAGFFGSVILTFYVLPAILVVPAWIGEALKALGLPVAAETTI